MHVRPPGAEDSHGRGALTSLDVRSGLQPWEPIPEQADSFSFGSGKNPRRLSLRRSRGTPDLSLSVSAARTNRSWLGDCHVGHPVGEATSSSVEQPPAQGSTRFPFQPRN